MPETPLITVDNPEIISISISQSPGLIAPAINCQIMPHLATPVATWFDYEPPALQLTIGSETYTCLPLETSIEIDPDNLGVAIDVQYYPDVLVKLQNTGLKKHLVFLSCSNHERALLEDEYDEDEYEVLHQPCDVYVSDGWTIEGILTEIGSRAGITIISLLPPFHVPNPTVVFKRGQKFLPFIRSLLPGDFEYLWQLSTNTLTVGLVQPLINGGSVAFIEGMYRMGVARSAVPSYDLVEIRGGNYKWGTTITLEEGGEGGSIAYPNGKIVTDSLPPEIKVTSDGNEMHSVTRKWKSGPEGTKFFSLLERITTVDGPYTTDPEVGNYQTLRIRESTEVYTYENDAPVSYLQPRQTEVATTIQQFYTKVVSGLVAGGSYQTYYLSDDSRVLSKPVYDALEEKPTIILTAYHQYGLAQQNAETFTWILEAEADKNWFEGTQTDNTQQKQQLYVKVNTVYYDALLSPKELLQQVLTDIATRDTSLSISSATSDIWRIGDITSKKIELLSEGAFQAYQERSIFDTKRGSMDVQTGRHAINGRPPGNPSKYRVEQLKVTMEDSGGEGYGGGSEICVPFFGEIPTNNPNDFKTWASLLWEQRSNPTRRVSMASFDRFLPMGSIYNGVTMTSFQVNQTEDGQQTVIMGGV